MVCYCGHTKDKHESERDSGYHQGSCTERTCSCTSYRNKIFVESNGFIKSKWHKRIEKTGKFK